MKYQRFEDLPVWQAGMDLAERVEMLAQGGAFQSKGDLCNQACRASLSVPTNIAEGFESGTTAQLLTSLYIARGSAGETRSLLRYADRLLDGRRGRERATPGGGTRHTDQKPPGSTSRASGSSTRAADGKSEISNSRSQISDFKSRPSDLEAPTADSESPVSDLKSQISNFKSEIANLITLSESCSRQIRGWADSLQNTDIKGQRYLTEKERKAYDSNRRAEVFMKQVDEVMSRRIARTDEHAGQ